MTFLTVGHSDHALAEFVTLLTDAGVDRLVDVRKMPGSRRNPQFDDTVLSVELPDAGVQYERIAELGGLRGRAVEVDPAVNGAWRNRSFHNYADYALSGEFRAGVTALREGGKGRRTAIMCAEAVWWRCHRRIIADHLLAAGEEVLHLMPGGRVVPATPTPEATFGADGSVTYPRA
ncbi:DUF488 domain-containing protein [Microbacterium sp.]|uniref:DUF488 domain-containing protein n=1 Tax=Microbacterium sp. TaxID=51671 RepID=UPI002811EE60|nr:DUF488 domain-containing protein [Microbacterium sp.]